MQRDSVPSNGTTSLGPLERALDVLAYLQGQKAPLALSDLARGVGLPKSTVHRLLAVLSRRAFVERDDEGRYRLGLGLVTLGLSVLDTEPLVRAAEGVLAEESRATGETLFVIAARGGELVVLAKAEGSGVLRATPTLGARVPVHATSAGRLYLAFAPDEIVLEPPPYPAFSDKTPTTKGQLDARVARARSRGWDVNVGEWVTGLAVVSAPIRRGSGELRGVLALAAPAARYEALGGAELAPRVVAAAERIAARLDGRALARNDVDRAASARTKGSKR